MPENQNAPDYDENDLIDSPLSQVLQQDNEQIEILIYRLPGSGEPKWYFYCMG